jgi:hypothetical protein
VTPLPRRCQILAGLWQYHRQNRLLSDFVETNDLGLPLAFAVYEGLTLPNADSLRIINKTWDAFVELCGKKDPQSDLLVDLRLVLALSKELPKEGPVDAEQAMFANWLDSLDSSSDRSVANA